jgi:hypothetical protein
MSRRLLSLFTALATVGTVVATAPVASASVSPRAPFSVLTTEGAAGSYLLDDGPPKLYTGSGVLVTPGGDSIVLSSTADSWSANVEAPTDGELTIGTHPTGRAAGPGVVGLAISGDGRGCNLYSGTIMVHEIARDAVSGVITTFAATYSLSCETTMPANVGELRYNSTVDYERFGTRALGETSAPATVTVTATEATTFGTASLEGPGEANFVIGADTCSGESRTTGQTCQIAVSAHVRDRAGTPALLRLPSASGDRVVSLTAVGRETASGAYTAVPSQRALDTRSAIGVSTHTAIGPGKTVDLAVLGRKGVPATGVSAVVLNITAIAPTSSGYLTVYPSTQPRPTASSINFVRGWTGANLVTVPVIGGPNVRFFNANGSTHVAADIVGYYHSAASTAVPSMVEYNSYSAIDPVRMVDTRDADWDNEPLPGGEYLWQAMDFGEADNARIRAFAVNVTVVAPKAAGFLTAFDGDSWRTHSTSTLNFTAGRTVPNMAIVKAGRCSEECDHPAVPYPRFGIHNTSSSSAHVIVDVVGVYYDGDPGDEGWRFKSLPSPKRFVDSRTALGLPANLGANQVRTVTTPASIAGYNTMAVVTTTTAAAPTSNTVLTLWANDGSTRPDVSNLNPYARQIVSNMTITEVGPGNTFRIHNNSGTAPVVMDAAGTMEYYPSLLVPADDALRTSRLAPEERPQAGSELRAQAGGRGHGVGR